MKWDLQSPDKIVLLFGNIKISLRGTDVGICYRTCGLVSDSMFDEWVKKFSPSSTHHTMKLLRDSSMIIPTHFICVPNVAFNSGSSAHHVFHKRITCALRGVVCFSVLDEGDEYF